MPEITLPYQWTPRPYQARVWNYLHAGGTRACMVWPRRHGKDEVCLQHTALAMGERKGVYWYLLPEYEHARKAIWDPIDETRGVRRIDLIFPPEIRTVYREKEMMVGYGGSYLQVVGADNYNALVGSPPVGLVFSEYARTDPAAWAYLMPILEHNGGWALFNSTPYGDNHFKRLYEYAQTDAAWFAELLTAPECGVFSDTQLKKIEEQLIAVHGEDYGQSLFRQEYLCSFDASLPGAYFADALELAKKEGRIRPFAVDRSLPVYTGWDIGRTDDTAIWFYQIINRELFFFHAHNSSLKDVDWYVEQVLLPVQEQYGIRYAMHWLPHDAKPRRMSEGAGSTLQQFQEHARRRPGLGSFAFLKVTDVQEGIQATRKTLQSAVFHDTHCAEGLKALKHYHRKWDAEERIFLATPNHDWSSHYADAMRTVSLTWRQPAADPPPEASWPPKPGVWLWKDLVQKHFTKKRQEREVWL